MVKVKLKGLKITRGKSGAYFVYRRTTGEALIKNFKGTRAALLKRMEGPDFVRVYNAPRMIKRANAKDMPSNTLGGLIAWYSNGDIDRCRDDRGKFVVPDLPERSPEDSYPKWRTLSQATREDYLKGFDYLRDAFTLLLTEIEQPDLYELRDRCANERKGRFADKMIAALSSMFKQGVKRGNKTGLKANPCLGMDKAHKSDPNANREWLPTEVSAAITNAPMEVKICLMAARYIGVRGQSIVDLRRSYFEDHPLTGKAVRFVARKNRAAIMLPVQQEFQAFVASPKVQRADGLIAVRDNGQPWPSEKEMQTRVSHYLRRLERKGIIGAGTTLHGLRVTYAAWWKRNGATNREIADLLGDSSEAMGAHYSRHVERESNVIRAFDRLKKDS